jgi:hypothetical protein
MEATALSFYVRKALATGPIRFAVNARNNGTTSAEDHERGFSTDARGSYRRLGKEVLFFADQHGLGGPRRKKEKRALTLWRYLRPDGARGWGRIALIGLGLLLILLGIAVCFTKGAQGLIEIVVGLGVAATPLVTTWRKIQELRRIEEAQRAEREALEARNLKLVGEFAETLRRLKDGYDDDVLASVKAEREGRDIPYDAVSSMARTAVLEVGFDALSRSAGSHSVARAMESTSDAVKLTPEDKAGVRHHLYQIVVWHLLVDDRLTDAQEESLAELRKALDLDPSAVARDDAAVAEFRRIRGLQQENLPAADCEIDLQFHEICYHKTSGAVMKLKREKATTPEGSKRVVERWVEVRKCDLFVTNKRVIIRDKKQRDIPLHKIFDVEIDADLDLLMLTTSDPKNPHEVSLRDPIYTARVIDIAASMAVDPARM